MNDHRSFRREQNSAYRPPGTQTSPVFLHKTGESDDTEYMTFLEKFLIYGIIGYIVYRWLKKKIAGPQPSSQIREVIRPIKGSEKMVRCSACQIHVPSDRATLHVPKRSEQFYMCVDCEYVKSKSASM
jgi:hypothetical protein